MEWDNSLTLEFISLYEKEEAIWNPRDPNHKNKFKVTDAWNNIHKSLSKDISVVEFKKKKESLMSTYRNLYQKVLQSKKSGAGSDEVYKPTWFCYDLLNNFLKDIYKPRKTISTEDLCNTDVCEEEEISNVEIHVEGVLAEDNSSNGPKKKQASLPIITAKRIRRDVEDAEIRSQMKEAYNLMKEFAAVPQESKDELNIYGELIVTKLRRLDPRNRAIVCNKIDNLLFDAEMEQIALSSTTSGSPAYYFHQSCSNPSSISQPPLPSPSVHSLHNSPQPPASSPSVHSFPDSPSTSHPPASSSLIHSLSNFPSTSQPSVPSSSAHSFPNSAPISQPSIPQLSTHSFI